MKRMLSTMIRIATVAHDGQFDKAGEPYILHPLKVMHYLKTDDEELQCIAVGHDLFEDTDVTAKYLRIHGISERIIYGITCLTKIKGQTYSTYKDRVKFNKDAILVKMAELRHNSDLRRLQGICAEDMERANRYMEFYKELEEARNAM